MASVYHKIDAYKVWFYTHNKSLIQVQVYNGANYIGTLNFVETDLIQQNMEDSHGLIQLYFIKNDYSLIMDLLRNEKPLFLWYNQDAKTGGIVTDEKESIGEGEH